MSLDRISLTLYDFLGYLLPGFVVLIGCSLAESTFTGSALFSLSRFGEDLLLYIILAYFFGSATHRIASLLKDWQYRWFAASKSLHLSAPVFERVREVAKDAYGVRTGEEEELDTLEVFRLADNYVVASGGSVERDVLMAREGFCKASMVAFGFLSLVLLSAVPVGGLIVQSQPNTFTYSTWYVTAALAAVTLSLAFLFRSGFIFYNRIKINTVHLTFLALREKDHLNRR